MVQFAFQLSDILNAEMKDGRCQGRVSMAPVKHFNEIARRSCSARGDDRNRNRLRHRAHQLAVKPGLGSIAIHRSQQDLPRSPSRGLPRPLNGVVTCRYTSSGNEHLKGFIDPFCIDCHHHCLRSKTPCDSANQCGVAHGGRVDRDLVGARIEDRGGVLEATDSSANRKRDK